MSGAVSSAQTRVYENEQPKIAQELAGQVSSHDLLNAKPEVKQEVQSQEPVADNVSTVETPGRDEMSRVEVAPDQKKPDSPRFRDMRQKAEQLERESREKEEIIQRLLRQQQAQQQPQYQPDPEFNLKDDDIPEARHIKQMYQKMSNMEQELKNYKQQSSTAVSKSNLRSQYPDYDQVMSQDNIKDLEYMRPSVARALATSGDFEGSAEAAYHMIKSLGIDKNQDTEVMDYDVQKKKAAANLSKPKPINAISKSNSPLSQTAVFSSELTKERKDEIWARMQKKLRTKKG